MEKAPSHFGVRKDILEGFDFGSLEASQYRLRIRPWRLLADDAKGLHACFFRPVWRPSEDERENRLGLDRGNRPESSEARRSCFEPSAVRWSVFGEKVRILPSGEDRNPVSVGAGVFEEELLAVAGREMRLHRLGNL